MTHSWPLNGGQPHPIPEAKMNNRFTQLNPIFADLPTSMLITKLENSYAFKSEELESELTARLDCLGQHWKFARGGRIEISRGP